MKKTKSTSISVAISRNKNVKAKREYVCFTIHDATQKEVVDFIKSTINSLGLPIVHEKGDVHTMLEVRMRHGRNLIGNGTYLSFWGLNAEKTKEVLMKHLA